MKNQSLNKCTLSNLVLTLGEEVRIPGRTSPEPSKKGSAFNLGSRTVKKNNMLLVAIVKCIKRKNAKQNGNVFLGMQMSCEVGEVLDI